MSRILLVGFLVLSCIIKIQDASCMNGKSMQHFVDKTINEMMNKGSRSLENKLRVLKDNRIVVKLWNHYKDCYGKKYQKKDEQERRGKFINNLEFIIKENERFDKHKKSFKLHLNQFGDMDLSEFRQKMTGFKSDGYITLLSMQRQKQILLDSFKEKRPYNKDKVKKKIHPEQYNTYNPRTSVCPSQPVTRVTHVPRQSTSTACPRPGIDYRQYMNPIKSQGECQSCYAFAVTAAIEGTYALKTGARIELSQQQIVDCSDNKGCRGGRINITFEYIERNGILKYDAYDPHMDCRQSCSSNSANVVRIKGYGNIPRGNESEMERALVNYGPLAAAIYVTRDLQFYGPPQRSGAFDIIDIPNCPKQVDHAITIVGYGTENEQDYWLVRNSWGDGWGLDGYFKVARNKDNMCGIATYNYYTEV